MDNRCGTDHLPSHIRLRLLPRRLVLRALLYLFRFHGLPRFGFASVRRLVPSRCAQQGI